MGMYPEVSFPRRGYPQGGFLDCLARRVGAIGACQVQNHGRLSIII
jgi:hypothetical protein